MAVVPALVAVSAVPPGLTWIWSGVTGCSVRSKPLGCGGAGAPGAGRAGIAGMAAAPVPGTSTTSTLPSPADAPRSNEIDVPSALGVPCTAPVQWYWGFVAHACACPAFHAPVAGQATTTAWPAFA